MGRMRNPSNKLFDQEALRGLEEGVPFQHILSSVKDKGVQLPMNAACSVFALGGLGQAAAQPAPVTPPTAALAPAKAPGAQPAAAQPAKPARQRRVCLPPPDIDSLVISSGVPVPPRKQFLTAAQVFDKLVQRLQPGDSVVLTTLQSRQLFQAGLRAKVHIIKRREGADSYRCWRAVVWAGSQAQGVQP